MKTRLLLVALALLFAACASAPATPPNSLAPLTEAELDAIVAKQIALEKGTLNIPGCHLNNFGELERIRIVGVLKGGTEFKALLARDGFDPAKWVNIPATRVIVQGRFLRTNNGIQRCEAPNTLF